jgi:hypothetical protein
MIVRMRQRNVKNGNRDKNKNKNKDKQHTIMRTNIVKRRKRIKSVKHNVK